MTQVWIVKKASVFAIVALFAVASVSAQATAPAPSPDAGAAFSVPMSGFRQEKALGRLLERTPKLPRRVRQ
nr:hypothetical protein LSAT_9X27681 [Tanacetum cinerariifolium]